MKNLYLLLVILLGFSIQGECQIGGQQVYHFLNLAPSARITAVGGVYISVKDDDLNLAQSNPAALNAEMHQNIALNTNFYFSGTGIMNGYAAYGYHYEPWETTFHAGVQFINYGTFDATNIQGDITGNFKAAEYALVLGASRNYNERLSYGASLKLISSNLESYNSFGIAVDLGGMYYHEEQNLGIGLVFKNMGSQITTYTSGNQEKLPFDVQLGFSKKLKYLPLRFTITAHHLHQWNITYDDPNQVDDTLFLGDSSTDDGTSNLFVSNLFRHFIFSGEFLFGKKENLRFQFGYNHLRRAELSIDNLRSLAGFNFGLGLKVKQFRIEYGRAIYHIVGGTNHLTIIFSKLR